VSLRDVDKKAPVDTDEKQLMELNRLLKEWLKV